MSAAAEDAARLTEAKALWDKWWHPLGTSANMIEDIAAALTAAAQTSRRDDERRKWEEQCVAHQVNAFGWMSQHDALLGFIQNRPEFLRALIDNDPRPPAPKPADVSELREAARREMLNKCIVALRALAAAPQPAAPQDEQRPHDYEGAVCKVCGGKYGPAAPTWCPAPHPAEWPHGYRHDAPERAP